MVQKYSRLLEEREINYNTDSIWAIQDVPKTWRKKTEQKVIADGFHFLDDGTVEPNTPPNVEEAPEEETEE